MTETFASHLSALTKKEISFADFQRWLVGYLMSDEGVDADDEDAAYEIENVLAEFTGGNIPLESFMETVHRLARQQTISSFLPGAIAQRRLRSSSSAQTVHVEFVAVT